MNINEILTDEEIKKAIKEEVKKQAIEWVRSATSDYVHGRNYITSSYYIQEEGLVGDINDFIKEELDDKGD